MSSLHYMLTTTGLTQGYKGHSINNSSLSAIKRWLTGQPGFMGSIHYLEFGSELHQRELEPHKPWNVFPQEEEYKLKCMLDSLHSDKEYMKYRKGAICEYKEFGAINGIPVHGTLDFQKVLRKNYLVVNDIKTTSTRSQREFEKSALKYDYIRQGEGIYKRIAKGQEVIFWGIQKMEPFLVFPFRPADYPNLIKEALEETDFLLHFYKTYGLPKGVEITQ